MSEMSDRIAIMIAGTLCVRTDRVTSETKLEDLGAESLERVEIGMAMEDEFALEIGDDEINSCHTVGDWQRLVEKLLNEQRLG